MILRAEPGSYKAKFECSANQKSQQDYHETDKSNYSNKFIKSHEFKQQY